MSAVSTSEIQIYVPPGRTLYQEQERCDSIALISIGTIFLVASIAILSLHLTHVLAPYLREAKAIVFTISPPAIGGAGFLAYGVNQYVQNAKKALRTAEEQAEWNIKFLLQHASLTPSHFEVIEEEDRVRVERVGIVKYAWRWINQAQAEDVEELRWLLDDNLHEIDQSESEYFILKARYNRISTTSQLFHDLSSEERPLSSFGKQPPRAYLHQKTTLNPSGYKQPVYTQGHWYHSHDEADHKGEAACIGIETQANRLGRLLTFGTCCQYFSQEETEADIYQNDPALVSTPEPSFQNIGHATLLIQMGSLNVITDPVFGDLNPVLYPRTTRPGLAPDELPPIDVILISHNHRDHCDVDSLTQLVSHQPIVLVPRGDLQFFRDIGFTNVYDHDWWTYSGISKGEERFVLCAVPAYHWSGRGACDAHESLICSWTIQREGDHGAVYFRGDSAAIPREVMNQISTFIEAPIQANFEPGGPNHRRSWMEGTHQSVLDSMITHFEVSKNPQAVGTYLMHHNAYELGTDRFNEAVMIKDQIIAFLETDLDVSNAAFKALPEFVQQELQAGKLARIQAFGLEFFVFEMKTHFFSPKIGERTPLYLSKPNTTQL